MAITTLDGVLAGMQQPQEILKVGTATVAGRHLSLFYTAGRPGTATAPTPGMSGVSISNTLTGVIPFVNPDPSENAYLGRFSAGANVAGTLILCDRLWHNSGIVVTVNTAQTINSVVLPPRDLNGASSGESVMIGLEVRTVMGAGTPTMTMTYTNSDGTPNRTITTGAFPTTLPANSFIPIELMTGDTGVQSIQTWTQSATMTSGAYHLVAYRQLARLDITAAGIGNSIDAITSGFPRFFSGASLFMLWLPSTTTAPTVSGQLIYTHG